MSDREYDFWTDWKPVFPMSSDMSWWGCLAGNSWHKYTIVETKDGERFLKIPINFEQIDCLRSWSSHLNAVPPIHVKELFKRIELEKAEDTLARAQREVNRYKEKVDKLKSA